MSLVTSPTIRFLNSGRGQELFLSNIAPEDTERNVLMEELNAHLIALQHLTAVDEPTYASHDGFNLGLNVQGVYLRDDLTGPTSESESSGDEKLSPLHQLSQNLKISIGQYRTILAPIRRIPAELLSLIFSQSVIGASMRINYALPLPEGIPPWNLTYVSRQWRAVAVSEPRLWTFLKYVPGLPARSLADEPPTALQLAMRRNGSALLDVTLRCARDSNPSSFESLPLLQLFVPQSSRLSRLAITDIDEMSAPILAPMREALPELSELHFDFGGDFNSQLDIFEHAPLLREVTLRAPSCDSLVLPWSQLTRFFWYASSRYLGRMPDISCLGLMHNLESLELQCHRPMRANDPPIFFKRLTSLVLDNSQKYAGATLAFMSRFHVPELRDFTFTVFRNEIEFFHAFQQRSGFNLTHLTITKTYYQEIHESDWLTLFSAVNGLKSLHIRSEQSGDSIICDTLAMALSIPQESDDNHRVPALNALHIGELEASSADGYTAFLDMIADRATYVPRTSRGSSLQIVVVERGIPLTSAMSNRMWPTSLMFMNGGVRVNNGDVVNSN